jgi:DNA-binding transcriptional LysR family regulator
MVWRKTMELNDLKIFIELYQNRSISKTAEKLSYTQSNISTRLIKLEQEFNTQLFVRTKSGLELSKDTERFYIHAKKIETSLQNLYQEFSMPSQEITVGSTQLLSRFFTHLYIFKTICSLFTPQVLRNFAVTLIIICLILSLHIQN